MVRYKYDTKIEAFRRSDKRGRPLYVNIAEAQRIVSLLNLGHSVVDVKNKVVLTNPKATSNTIDSFIKNYDEGNIDMPDDAPAPSIMYSSITDGDRIAELEDRVSKLEEELEVIKNNKKSLRERLGL